MPDRKINVMQVLKDISSGMNDQELMRKYRISSKGLADLYSQLVDLGFLEQNGKGLVVSRKRRIPMNQLVNDLKAGLDKRELMAKYMCSSKRLHGLVAKLLAIGVINQTELQKSGLLSDWADLRITPRLPRNYLPYPFPVYEVGNPNSAGLILDITEQGLKVEGLDVQVGETKTLSIIATDVSEARPFFLDVICRWVSEDSRRVCTAGFEISKTTDKAARELRKFIQALAPSIW